jgi:Zn-dependent protease
MDLLGSVLLPLLLMAFRAPLFGWGRPAPVVPQNLRRPGRDDILVAAAGPFANALLAAAAAVATVVAVHVLGEEEARRAAFWALAQKTEGVTDLPAFPVMFTLVRMATINAFLMVFNLIPLPPLDGGQIALQLLPPDWAARLAAVRPYGLMIGVALAVSHLVTVLLLPFYGLLGVMIHLL